MFRSFVNRLTTRLAQDLPGENVQFSMAPITREKIKEIPKENYHPRKSAVLILLFPVGNSIKTLLIQRPEYDGVHSGQVAFPGGKFEESDVTLQQTALREAFEEVGIIPEMVNIIGNLTDVYITPSNFLVTPFIGIVSEMPTFIADEREVHQLIEVDLLELNNKAIQAEKMIAQRNGYLLKTPYYNIAGLTVWGATAMMISELNVVVNESEIISF
jgi:8-oxo-dGTP pyrophosphatase MutT (NUDIX family)